MSSGNEQSGLTLDLHPNEKVEGTPASLTIAFWLRGVLGEFDFGDVYSKTSESNQMYLFTFRPRNIYMWLR